MGTWSIFYRAYRIAAAAAAAAIAYSKTTGSYRDSKHITRVKVIAFVYITTFFINMHLNNDRFLNK